MKQTQRIEIVSSSMKGLSSMSPRSRQSLLTSLRKNYSDVRVTIVNNITDLSSLKKRRPDLVVLGMKFIPQDPALGFQDENKIWLSDYLDVNNIAYTGSNQFAHELELNKQLAKNKVHLDGVATSPYFFAKQGLTPTSEHLHLRYPVFIKPSDRGGGQGIDEYSVAHNFEQALSKITSIATLHGSDALVEEFLEGREFSVAILRVVASSSYYIMPIELVAAADEHGSLVLSQNMKSSNQEIVLPVLDPVIRAKVSTLAMKAFTSLGGRDYGRIDMRMDSSGEPHFLEANLIPSLITGYGSFPKACVLNQDLHYDDMILHIVQLGLERHADSSAIAAMPLAKQL